MSKKIAVILAGSGHLDGSEMREVLFSLLTLDQQGAEVRLFAPDRDQHHVVNHRTGEEMSGERRHMLTEAARLTRGPIESLEQLNPKEFDGLVIPGGFGVAKNLCRFAFEGAAGSVLPEVDRTVKGFFDTKKPIAALCIAPAMIARILGEHQVEVTIGEDAGTAAEVEKTGAKHINCAVTSFHVDSRHKIVTTPAYMFGDARLKDVFEGIQKGLKSFMELV